MPLHKNKILISSGVYFASLLVVALIFGMWHNLQLNGAGNYFYFIILVFLDVCFLSWFYFTIFKQYRKEISEIESIKPDVEILNISDIINPEEKVTKKFDKEAFISGILPENKKLFNEYCEALLKNLADKLNIVQGLFYIKTKAQDTFEVIARYAYYSEEMPPAFKVGENLPGQALKDKRIVIIQNIPDSYIPVVSGLGSSKPKSLVLIPIFAENESVGLIEIAVFTTIDADIELALKDLSGIIGESLIKLMK